MKILTKDELEKNLKDLEGWEIKNDRLYKQFKFSHFPASVLFVNQLVNLVEEFTTYPEIRIRYNLVEIFSFTHELGGISSKDINLAKGIEEII
jgi:4a-hydroxytetrahydrobiopterin dehydratase